MKTQLLILALLTCLSIQAQEKAVSKAKDHLNQYLLSAKTKLLHKAQKKLDQAIEHEDTKNQLATWYYRALVYQKMMEDQDSNKLVWGKEAIRSAIQARELTDSSTQLSAEQLLKDLDSVTFEIGVQLYSSQDFAKALSFHLLAEQAQRAIDGLDSAVLYNIATMAQMANDSLTASRYFQLCMEGHYRGADPYVGWSSWLVEQGHTKEAKRIVDLGRESFPENLSLITQLVNIYLKEQKWEEAIEAINVTMERDPDNALLYFARGSLYDALGKADLAEQDYLIAVEIDSNYFDAYFNLAALHFNRGAEIISGSIEVPVDDNKTYQEMTKRGRDEMELSLPYLEKAHALRPKDRATLVSMRHAYQRTQNWEKVAEVKRLLKELDKENPTD
ncbi:hypothetical protein KFE98_17820 [bacterium SCSIO 12741]|nr:hypothetical protein KFE98_17820 [bacterium SCSIO 12741]